MRIIIGGLYKHFRRRFIKINFSSIHALNAVTLRYFFVEWAKNVPLVANGLLARTKWINLNNNNRNPLTMHLMPVKRPLAGMGIEMKRAGR